MLRRLSFQVAWVPRRAIPGHDFISMNFEPDAGTTDGLILIVAAGIFTQVAPANLLAPRQPLAGIGRRFADDFDPTSYQSPSQIPLVFRDRHACATSSDQIWNVLCLLSHADQESIARPLVPDRDNIGVTGIGHHSESRDMWLCQEFVKTFFAQGCHVDGFLYSAGMTAETGAILLLANQTPKMMNMPPIRWAMPMCSSSRRYPATAPEIGITLL